MWFGLLVDANYSGQEIDVVAMWSLKHVVLSPWRVMFEVPWQATLTSSCEFDHGYTLGWGRIRQASLHLENIFFPARNLSPASLDAGLTAHPWSVFTQGAAMAGDLEWVILTIGPRPWAGWKPHPATEEAWTDFVGSRQGTEVSPWGTAAMAWP
jgi:hypothetical protein